jgi:hypothetical protein
MKLRAGQPENRRLKHSIQAELGGSGLTPGTLAPAKPINDRKLRRQLFKSCTNLEFAFN